MPPSGTGSAQRLADRESVQLMLGGLAMKIEIGRLLVMKAAWELDRGGFARKEVSMAKVQVANVLHEAADMAIQINGARGYSKDTVLEWIYRYARQARLVDGADEVHRMVLNRFLDEEGAKFLALGPAKKLRVLHRLHHSGLFTAKLTDSRHKSSPHLVPEQHKGPIRRHCSGRVAGLA